MEIMSSTPNYFWHVTTNTGHAIRSYRDQVDPKGLEIVSAWLDEALRDDTRILLPGNEYEADVELMYGAICATIYARHSDEPCLRIGVARRSRGADRLWAHVTAVLDGAPDVKRPDAPWLAVTLEGGLLHDPAIMQWASDFERLLGWAWIEKKSAK